MSEQTTSPSAPASDTRNSQHKDNGTAATYLGPARVLECNGQTLLVELSNATQDQVSATTAFTFPYEPAIDDVLLVLGHTDGHFAVGVLTGAKPQALVFQGEAQVRTINGKLTLASDEAIELTAPSVTIRTGVLRTIATKVVEKAESMRRWVRGVFALRAGKSRRIIDGEDNTQCKNSTTLAKDTVTIDGDQLHLGH